jgi:hypothetical protein
MKGRMRTPRQEEDPASFRLITPTVLLVLVRVEPSRGGFHVESKGGTPVSLSYFHRTEYAG